MSYNILNKNVNFQGTTQGTIEDVVDTHSTQTIKGLKTITHLTGTHVRITNDVVSLGNISASVNISASAFYAKGVEITAGGAVSAVADGANNRIATFTSTDALAGEANLTFDGSSKTLTLATSGAPTGVFNLYGTLSGSGNISGSAFFGNGANISNVNAATMTLASNSGLANSSGLIVDPNSATETTSADGADFLLVADNGDSNNLKKITCQRVANLFNAAVTTYGGNTVGRIIVANGSGDIQGNANLTIDAGSKLTLNGAMDITGLLSGSGIISGTIGHFVTRVEGGAISLGDASGIAGAGLANSSGELDIQVSGALKVASDKVGITGSLAGYGIAYAGGVDSISSLKVDFGSLTEAVISRTNDFIPFVDADDGETKRESVADLVGFIAGSGLDASSGQLSVDVSDFMAAGVNNRVLTATGADAMTGEENLTFNGSLLTVNGTGSVDRVVIGDNDPSGNRLLISGSNTENLFEIKQQGNGYPTAFLAGENHSTYPGLLYNRGKLANVGAISQGNIEGDAGSHTRLTVRKTSISDNTATDIVTVTVPNANHAAAIRVFGLANYDACNYAQVFSFEGIIARSSGAPTDKAFSSVSVTENANLGGGQEFSLAVAGSSNTGGNSATQTFTLQLTIDTDTGSSSNATIMIELINFNNSGITMAAS